MAIYHLDAGIIGRGRGHSAVAAAAYRARTALEDDRFGKTRDYTRAYGGNDLLFAGIYAPANAPDWAQDREKLWNQVERAEKRVDAQLARDFTIALPHELTPEQNRWLLQDFIKEQFTRKGYAVDLSIHKAHEHGDDRNVHAHMMVAMRTIGPDGFARKKDRSENSTAQLQQWREAWARHANHHLERHGHEARIDHRSLAEQGVDREPSVHMGKAAAAMERRGEISERGELNRAIEARNDSITISIAHTARDTETPEYGIDLPTFEDVRIGSLASKGTSAAIRAVESLAEGLENFLFGGAAGKAKLPPKEKVAPVSPKTEGQIVREKLGAQEPTVLAQNPEVPRYRFGVDPELVEELRRKREQREREERGRDRER